jgi:CRISPR-associated protein Cas5h
MPIEMNISRIVSEYSEIIIETNGKTINVKSDSIYQTETLGNILFL